MTKNRYEKLALIAFTAIMMSSPSFAAGKLGVNAFGLETGIKADPTTIQQTWQSLKTMGTTDFLGGMLGNFKLDESSMIAGALTLGSSEFDNFLRSGSLSLSSSNVGSLLSSKMSSAAGIDLSSFTGSYTQGGGSVTSFASASSLLTSGAASSGSATCDPETAQKLVDVGNTNVSNVVNASMSSEYGFSKMSSLNAKGGTGFSALSCIDKLFQGSGVDIMFKPPSLGSLTTSLQNWSCPQASTVAEQVGGAFSNGIQTAGVGGFFPTQMFGEANENAQEIGVNGDKMFGSKFVSVEKTGDTIIKKYTSLNSVFR